MSFFSCLAQSRSTLSSSVTGAGFHLNSHNATAESKAVAIYAINPNEIKINIYVLFEFARKFVLNVGLVIKVVKIPTRTVCMIPANVSKFTA